MVYLIHMDTKIAHAQHYIGSSKDIDARLVAHKSGQGARLLQVANGLGITYSVVRTWRGGRVEERLFHRRKASPRLCPTCREGR